MNLANLLDCMGDFRAAEILYKETVAGLSATVGKTHTSTLMVRAAITHRVLYRADWLIRDL
jgi:hypothetical protein